MDLMWVVESYYHLDSNDNQNILLGFCLLGGYSYSQKETMWIICQCIWTSRTLQLCHMDGVDMLNSA